MDGSAKTRPKHNGVEWSCDNSHLLSNEPAPNTQRTSWLVDDSPGRGTAVF